MKQGASLIFATSLFVATFVQAQSRPAALQQILPLLQQEVIAARRSRHRCFSCNLYP